MLRTLFKREQLLAAAPMGRISEADVRARLQGVYAVPTVEAIRELIARYREAAMETAGDEGQPEAVRLGALTRISAMRDLENGIVQRMA